MYASSDACVEADVLLDLADGDVAGEEECELAVGLGEFVVGGSVGDFEAVGVGADVDFVGVGVGVGLLLGGGEDGGGEDGGGVVGGGLADGSCLHA